MYNTITSEDDLFAYTRGDNALIILTNTGESFNRTLNVGTLKEGQFCNVFDTNDDNEFLDCFIKSDDEQSIDIEQGAGKFYVATGDIPIVTTKFYAPTAKPTVDDETTAAPTEDADGDGIDRIHIGIFAVFITILMTFCNF